MPGKGKKGKGGKKGKKRKKGNNETNKRELTLSTEDTVYGRVNKMLGNGRLMALCTDGRTRNAIIRGKFKKRVWMNPDDIILIEKDAFDDTKGLVVHRYYPEEIKLLKKMKELTFPGEDEENNTNFGGL